VKNVSTFSSRFVIIEGSDVGRDDMWKELFSGIMGGVEAGNRVENGGIQKSRIGDDVL
jgi:hypothetical protein